MRLLLTFSTATILLAACNSSGDIPGEADIDAVRGEALFVQNCAVCHGPKGQGGRGPDLTGLSIRADGAFPSDYVMATIDGLGRHGDAGAVMPEFGARGLGDTVVVEHDGVGTPVPADLLALTAYLETLQRLRP